MNALTFFRKKFKGSTVVAKARGKGHNPKDDRVRGICGHCEGDCGSADSR